jgi:hypothetical protein
MTDRCQQQRFEFKYIIPEQTALAVRDFVSAYLVPDEFGARSPDLSYAVHSLYVDSNDLALYRSTINGDKNRHKLRVRYYEQNGPTPLFFEVKRRNDNVISKTRAKVRREAFQRLMAGDLPQPEDLAESSEQQMQSLDYFCRLRRAIDAGPVSQVSYRREAWLPPDGNTARVTFDRDVRTGPDRNAGMNTATSHLPCVFGDQVILELKFTNRFPDWMREMVRIFLLVQVSAAKYVEGIIMLGEDRMLCGDGGGRHPRVDQRRLLARHGNFQRLTMR